MGRLYPQILPFSDGLSCPTPIKITVNAGILQLLPSVYMRSNDCPSFHHFDANRENSAVRLKLKPIVIAHNIN